MQNRNTIIPAYNPQTGQTEGHDLPTVARAEFDAHLAERVGPLNDAERQWVERASRQGWHLNGIAEELAALRANPECEWAHQPPDDGEIRGWYVIFPDGGAWIAVDLASATVQRVVEEAAAQTHIAARDRLAPIAQAVEDERTHDRVSERDARRVLDAFGAWCGVEMLPENCVVERLGLGD